MLRLHVNPFDYTILAIYFALVITIGVIARRAVATSEDFLLSGRSLPAWVTGLAFISANLGAIEILGMAANGAQYGMSTVHFYWIGAVPAMVFLGIVMMPFYYGSRVRSVPEFLRRRFNPATHLFNALTFALAAVLIAGVNLYALALVIHALIGWPIWLSIVVSALFVLAYITLGGLSGAIYNEVLQFFVIIAGLVPLVIIGLQGRRRVERPAGQGRSHQAGRARLLDLGRHRGRALDQPARRLDRHRLRPRLRAVVRLLDDELRRGAARPVGQGPVRGPAHAADRGVPEDLHPRPDHHPRPDRAGRHPQAGRDQDVTYNNAIPVLMNKYLPNGALGIALAGLLAAFMAGMAANVSSFNTVVHLRHLADLHQEGPAATGYYLNVGRVVTVVGILIGDRHGVHRLRLQQHHELHPVAVLVLQRAAVRHVHHRPCSGSAPRRGPAIAGLAAGTIGAAVMHFAGYHIAYFYPHQVYDPTHAKINAQMVNFYGAIVAFVADAGGHGDRHPGDQAEAGRRARRPGLGRARPERARPGERAQAGLVGVAQAARRRRPGHRPRPVHHLHRSQEAVMSEVPDTGRRSPAVGGSQALRPAAADRRPVPPLRGHAHRGRALHLIDRNWPRPADININLWLGIGMLIIGGFFTTWWRLSPLRRDPPQPDATGTGQ